VVRANSALMGAREFDAYQARITLVLMDGCLGGDTLNSLPLIRYIRQYDYTGPMIAGSGLADYRADMVTAGCSHQAAKDGVPALANQLLGGD
jgi:hypothetical protein